MTSCEEVSMIPKDITSYCNLAEWVHTRLIVILEYVCIRICILIVLEYVLLNVNHEHI